VGVEVIGGVGVTVGKRAANEFVLVVVRVVVTVARLPIKGRLLLLVGTVWLRSSPSTPLTAGVGVTVGSERLTLLAGGWHALTAKARSRSQQTREKRVSR
jgi:hypothetical protein